MAQALAGVGQAEEGAEIEVQAHVRQNLEWQVQQRKRSARHGQRPKCQRMLLLIHVNGLYIGTRHTTTTHIANHERLYFCDMRAEAPP
jgi:hypothetical protein